MNEEELIRKFRQVEAIYGECYPNKRGMTGEEKKLCDEVSPYDWRKVFFSRIDSLESELERLKEANRLMREALHKIGVDSKENDPRRVGLVRSGLYMTSTACEALEAADRILSQSETHAGSGGVKDENASG